jgi:hypothetical protein
VRVGRPRRGPGRPGGELTSDELDGAAPGRPERLDLPTGARPLEEHTPPTVAELGLELDLPPPDTRRRRMLLIVAALVVLLAGAWWLLSDGGEEVAVTSLAPGDCFSPAREVLLAEVERDECDGGHDAELVAVLQHPDEAGEFPGPEALALYGEAACRPAAEQRAGRPLDELADDGIALRIAAPDGDEWAAGERRLACSYVAISDELEAPVAG